MALRLAIAGGTPTSAAASGTVFAAVLLILAGAAGWMPSRPQLSAIVLGLAGAAVLCAPPLVLRVVDVHPWVTLPPASSFPLWAATASTVAVAEEVLLRGALFAVVARHHGDLAAVAVAALAFGVLHVPMYGWQALPLDIAVGVWLGGLRVVTGGVAAPAVAHTTADLAAWWLA